jgi:hypothetical protein
MSWVDHGADKKLINILVKKPEGHKPLWKPTRRWDDNKVNFKEKVVWA